MNISRMLFAVVVYGFLAGCATPLKPDQVSVIVDSEPAGAMIYWGDKAYGVAPQTLVFTLTPEAIQRGWVDDNNIRAIWPSGAERKGIRLSMNLRNGYLKFSRPPDAPGLDKDMAYAVQVSQLKAQQAQAAAASDTADTFQNLFLLWLSK